VLPAAVQGFPTGVLALCDVCTDGVVLTIGLAMDEVCQVETEILAGTPKFFLVLNKKIDQVIMRHVPQVRRLFQREGVLFQEVAVQT
jgi:hypothetical protein